MEMRYLPVVVLSLLGVLAGCARRSGDFPELAQVQGVITFDGQPLPNARVVFEPESGRPSYGKTNDAGTFTLTYLHNHTGAIIGSHLVRVSTADMIVDPRQGTEVAVAERIPKVYNTDSILTADVRAGKNEIVLELQSNTRN